jgi:hypothetical protein
MSKRKPVFPCPVWICTECNLALPWPARWGSPADDKDGCDTCPCCGAVAWKLLNNPQGPPTAVRDSQTTGRR